MQNESRPDTEQLILKAAEEEFFSKGFDGARTAAIAEKAGVTHAMLHYYFRTKEKLFDKILDTKTSEMRGVMLGFVCNGDLPLAERIERGMRRHFEYMMKNPQLPFFITNELHRNSNKVMKYLQINKETASEIQKSLQVEIDAAAARGECRQVSARSLMLDIVSLNAFPFMAAPLIGCLFSNVADNSETVLKERLEENIKTVISKMRT